MMPENCHDKNGILPTQGKVVSQSSSQKKAIQGQGFDIAPSKSITTYRLRKAILKLGRALSSRKGNP